MYIILPYKLFIKMRRLHHRFLLIILFRLFVLSTARYTVTPTQPLADQETLISSNGYFVLGFFSPAGSSNRYLGLWYNKVMVPTILWVANRKDPVINSTGILSITAKGTLTIYNNNSMLVWSTKSTNLANPVAELLDTGNFVVKRDGDDTNSCAWQGFDYPTDTLIPGMRLGVDLTSGLNRTLTSWRSDSDPSPGDYYVYMDIYGDPQFFLCIGSYKIWRSWAHSQLNGMLSNTTYFGFTSSFVNSNEEVVYSFDTTNNSVVSRIVVTQSGIIQGSLWVLGNNEWSVCWHVPQDQCDFFGACGPYGVCDPNTSPICSCLPGFTPTNPTNWNLRVWSDGCVREKLLDCKSNTTDGFLPVSHAKLPDSDNSILNMSLSLDGCRDTCLLNCSCTAYASANVNGSRSGCLIWFLELLDSRVYNYDGHYGHDVYLRLAASQGSLSSLSHYRRFPILAAVLSVVLGTLLLATAVCCTWRKMKRTRDNASRNVGDIAESTRDDRELPVFNLGAIKAATNNFSEENKLGEGGFGLVYKGKMRDGQEIAVKRLSRTSVQGLDELKTEVMLVAELQHRNLVRLLGCCIQGDERILIYEYMPNKSLDAFLFDEEKAALLDWEMRYQIIVGIAQGLLYLHRDSRFRIIHRDLKAGNVLLDKEMKPKISDFGLARSFGGDEAKTKTRRVVGTYGYMSPEYALNGIFSVKSDVFSFGVLVLEIISGKRNKGVYLSEAEEYLLGKAWALWKEDNALQLVDAAVDCIFSTSEVLRCINVGLLCVQERPEDRPTMASVVLMLGGDSTNHSFLPEPKEPGFVARKDFLNEGSSSKEDTSHSLNDVTITLPMAR